MAAGFVLGMSISLAGCAGGRKKINDGTFRPVDEAACVSLKRKNGALRYDQLSGKHRIPAE